MKIIQPEEATFLKCLVYGPAGHGKTRFLATAENDSRTSPMLFLDFEGGTSSLVGSKVDIVRIRSWNDYNEVYEELKRTTMNGTCKYKSIAVDSLSETHQFALLSALDLDKRNRKDQDMLQLQDYGKALIQLRRFIRVFRDLPLHVFFSSLPKEETDPREGTIKKPALSGTLSEEAGAMLDVQAYLAISSSEKGPVRFLLLQNYPKIRTKVRASIGWDIPDEIENPSVTSLFDALGIQENSIAKGSEKSLPDSTSDMLPKDTEPVENPPLIPKVPSGIKPLQKNPIKDVLAEQNLDDVDDMEDPFASDLYGEYVPATKKAVSDNPITKDVKSKSTSLLKKA